MNEADILAATYDDTCRVYRPFTETLDNGETVSRKGLQGQKVYTSLPCALAKHSGGKLKQSPSTATAPTEYVVFTRPEVEILPGDTLSVTHLGRTAIYTAGEADRHVSHRAVPVTPTKGTV